MSPNSTHSVVLTAPLSAASTLSLAGLATSAEASLIGLEPPGIRAHDQFFVAADHDALDTVTELAAQQRVDSIRSSTSAGSGHPTSSMSAADLLAVLAARHLRFDWDDPKAPANDHLILSKGHASRLLYPAFKAVGVVSEDELMPGTGALRSACKATRRPFSLVDIATGSLGQGLPDGVGIAERASGRPADGGLVSLPGVISRRKRVAPGLLAAAAR